MVAKLDLRIPGRTKSKTEAETGLKHYLVFAAAAAFLFTVLAVLLLGGWKLYSLHNEKLAAADEKNTLTQNSEIMDKEYARLNGEASSLDARLSYMLDDIPAVEVLTTLDTLLPNGVVLESVSISGGKVTFKGSALKEDAALQFVNKLSGASFVSSVNVPDITNIQLKNIKARSFSVECVLRPTREILESGALENNSQQGAPAQPAPASEDAKGDAAQ